MKPPTIPPTQLLKQDTKPKLKDQYKKPVDMKPPTMTPPTQLLKQEPKKSLTEEQNDAKLLKDLKEGKTYFELVDDSDDETPAKKSRR